MGLGPENQAERQTCWPAELGASTLQIDSSHEPNKTLSRVVISALRANVTAEGGAHRTSLTGVSLLWSGQGYPREGRLIR